MRAIKPRAHSTRILRRLLAVQTDINGNFTTTFTPLPGEAGLYEIGAALPSAVFDATRSEQNPILFPAPDGRLWLLHTAQRAGHQNTAVVRCRTSTDDGQTWDAPRDLLPPTNGCGLFVRQPPVVRADGAWLLPVFRCRALPGLRWSGDDDDSVVYISHDQGQTWQTREVPQSSG